MTSARMQIHGKCSCSLLNMSMHGNWGLMGSSYRGIILYPSTCMMGNSLKVHGGGQGPKKTKFLEFDHINVNTCKEVGGGPKNPTLLFAKILVQTLGLFPPRPIICKIWLYYFLFQISQTYLFKSMWAEVITRLHVRLLHFKFRSLYP